MAASAIADATADVHVLGRSRQVTSTATASGNDDQLLLAIAGGDHYAFTELVNRHGDAVHGYLLRLTGTRSDAEDLTQETFLRVWRKAGSYEPGRVRASTWLHRIAHNLCIDSFRRARPERSLDDIEALGSDEDLYRAQAARETVARLELALRELPDNQRAALLLCQVQGFSNAEAAEILGLKVRAVESLLARARRSLRKRLQSEEHPP